MSVLDRLNLTGKVALVTGGGSGLGQAIALSLADAGADVVICGRRTGPIDETRAMIEAKGRRALAISCDVTDETQVNAMISSTIGAFGRLDILVNNASVRREVDFAQLDYREWREVLATTLDAAYLCSHAALPHLIAAGSGSIVNIGGLSAHTGAAKRAHVIAAKAGLVGLTRALAHDLAPHRITVNCVAPGLIDTVRAGGKEPSHHAVHHTLTGRRGAPEEIAALVRFLCGPEARYITGQTIHANGGAFVT